MTLTLFLHPLSSFCHKVLIALYEDGTPFEPVTVNFGDEASRAEFFALWPLGKIPVLRDAKLGRVIPETSIIIEYLETHYPGVHPLLPRDEARRLDARLWDRMFDLHFQLPMQKIVGDRLRPEGERDPRGVADAAATLRNVYGILERHLTDNVWAAGDAFSIADCAAVPALFYGGIVVPFTADHPNIATYFERLLARPSVARTLAEAKPFFQYFPMAADIPKRFL